MLSLVFNEYLSQGGDIGSFDSRMLAHAYDECVGTHPTPNFWSLPMFELTYRSQHVRHQRDTRQIQIHRI
jgi:hypothetical protein